MNPASDDSARDRQLEAILHTYLIPDTAALGSPCRVMVRRLRRGYNPGVKWKGGIHVDC
jgi:hypothetical protein